MRIAMVLLAGAVTLSACSGSDDDGDGPSPTPTVSTGITAPTPTRAPQRPRPRPTSTPGVQATPVATAPVGPTATATVAAETPTPTPTGGAAPTATPTPTTLTRWLTGYYASYSEFPPASMPPTEVDYTALTHVIHWPVVPRGAGTFDPDEFGMTAAQSAALVAAAHAAGAKALLGFGGDVTTVGTGWRTSTDPANRAGFIDRIVNLMLERGYDGIDINWEGLGAADADAFTAFILELRAALDQISPRPLLTMPPTLGFDAPIAIVVGVEDALDQINLQTYVMSGPFPGWVTWFNSPLFNGGFTFPSTNTEVPSIDDEIDRYLAAGIPAAKIGLGIQFDAFVWAGGSGTDTGGATKPRQTWTYGNPQPPDGRDVGAPTLSVIRVAEAIATFTQAAGYTAFFDAVAQVPYLSLDDLGAPNDRFVSLENDASIEAKADYLAQKGLGGAFIFELSGDYFPMAVGDAKHPLLTSAREHIREGFVAAMP